MTEYPENTTDDDAEADRRFRIYASSDPFPAIPATLLNSADIFDYVRIVGIVCPFVESQLKPASYSIRIGNKVVYWDKHGKRQELELKADGRFVLDPNSILFVTTKEKFRLPDYMAIRFNLKINHIHRGLLLGTGPIVDPGFEGELLVPLHNLTTNEYPLYEGETFAWVEFTKISPNKRWNEKLRKPPKGPNLLGQYHQFPQDKKNLSADFYLKDAFDGPIRSSIPDVTESARKDASSAKVDAQEAARSAREIKEKLENQTKIISFAGAIGLVAILITVVVGIAQLVGTFHQSVGSLHTEFRSQRDQQATIRKDLASTSKSYAELRALITKLEAQILSLEKSRIRPESVPQESKK